MAASSHMLTATTIPTFYIHNHPSPLKRNAVSLNPSFRLPPLLSIRRRILLPHYTYINCTASSTSSPSFTVMRTKKPRKDSPGGVAWSEKGPALHEMAMEALCTAMQAMQAPVVSAIVIVVLMFSNPLSALAATGGRMGGHSYSSRSSSYSSYSSSASSSSSSSYSSSSRRSRRSSWSSNDSFVILMILLGLSSSPSAFYFPLHV